MKIVLVSSRRPLTVQDENEEESIRTMSNAFQYFKTKIHTDNIYLLTHAPDHSLYEQAKVLGRVYPCSPTSFVKVIEEIEGEGNKLIIYFVGHGGTDKEDEEWDFKVKRGLDVMVRQRLDTNRYWLLFPQPAEEHFHLKYDLDFDKNTFLPAFKWSDNSAYKEDTTLYSIHWQELARLFYEVLSSNKFESIHLILGCCYSGGLFQWFPEHSLDVDQNDYSNDSNRRELCAEIFKETLTDGLYDELQNLNIYVITSADNEFMAGTWFWYEWLRTIKENESMSFQDIYKHLHSLNPDLTFDHTYNNDARGDITDAIMISQFHSANLQSESITSLFTQI